MAILWDNWRGKNVSFYPKIFKIQIPEGKNPLKRTQSHYR
jgi:hypothetical protein